MPNTTANENAVLLSAFHNTYGEEGDCFWAWAHNDSSRPHNLPKTTVPGVIGSLVKKGLMYTDGEGSDAVLGLTDEGRAIAADLDANA